MDQGGCGIDHFAKTTKKRSETYLLDFEKILSDSVFIYYICFFPEETSLGSMTVAIANTSIIDQIVATAQHTLLGV
jgi:hypothetical protein